MEKKERERERKRERKKERKKERERERETERGRERRKMCCVCEEEENAGTDEAWSTKNRRKHSTANCQKRKVELYFFFCRERGSGDCDSDNGIVGNKGTDADASA